MIGAPINMIYLSEHSEWRCDTGIIYSGMRSSIIAAPPQINGQPRRMSEYFPNERVSSAPRYYLRGGEKGGEGRGGGRGRKREERKERKETIAAPYRTLLMIPFAPRISDNSIVSPIFALAINEWISPLRFRVPRPAAELRPDCAINGGKKKKERKERRGRGEKMGLPAESSQTGGNAPRNRPGSSASADRRVLLISMRKFSLSPFPSLCLPVSLPSERESPGREARKLLYWTAKSQR